MSELKDAHPDIHQQFESSHHVVRRSNRHWAGLSTDLVIEQVLMRSMTTPMIQKKFGTTMERRIHFIMGIHHCVTLQQEELLRNK